MEHIHLADRLSARSVNLDLLVKQEQKVPRHVCKDTTVKQIHQYVVLVNQDTSALIQQVYTVQCPDITSLQACEFRMT